MEFEQLIQDRCSVLEYERRDVSPELIQKILDVARATPTACNLQLFDPGKYQ